MKSVTTILSILILATSISASQAELKVGIVDMNKAFISFYKTKDAEVKINARRKDAKAELDKRLESLSQAVEEINKLQQEIQRPELSDDARQEKQKVYASRATETRNLDREVAEFRTTQERQIQEQFIRMRKEIIDQIMTVVDDTIKVKAFDLVFDKSGLSMGQVPVVLYSRDDMEFTDDIIKKLNADAPAGATAPAASGEKPAAN
ncbi:MAG: OmpH family outer membrane protein [Chthoniobacterales bacterium]